MRNLIITFCVVIFTSGVYSQVTMKPKVPNIYALIVGVSEYQIPSYNLDYAVNDCREFYKFLVKSNYGQVNPQNIDTLFNKDATSAAIFTRLSSFKNKLQENDIIFFYFSGHGDANEEGAYLLAHDAPDKADKNNYNANVGVVDIDKLKRIISNISNKKVNFVLITDACRTNELAGGADGQNKFGKAIEEKAGEMRFTSCKTNQFSYEGPQWGNGRSVFSYHLINGLSGLADVEEDKDGGSLSVTFDELENYVSQKVKEDTKNQPKGQQIPQIVCAIERDEDSSFDCESIKLNYYKKSDKDLLISILNNQSSLGDIAAVAKGVDVEDILKKYGKEGIYHDFTAKAKEGKLIGPGSAREQFDVLQNDPKIPKEVKQELNDKYCIYLGNSVNRVVNQYLDGSRKYSEYSKEYFMDAYDKLEVFKELSTTYEYEKEKIDANSYFFIGHSYFQATKIADLKLGLAYLDSALALNPKAAYIYNARAVLGYRFKHWNELLHDLSMARKFAPGWSTPVNNAAFMYLEMGSVDSSFIFNLQAIELNPNNPASYTLRSQLHNYVGNRDSALIYVEKALEIDPLDYNALYWKAYLTSQRGEKEEAKQMFRDLVKLNPKSFDGLAGILDINIELYPDNVDSIQVYMQGIINSDTTNGESYKYLADKLYGYGLYDLAAFYYNYAYIVDPLSIQNFIGLGQVHEKLFEAKGDYSYLDTSILYYGYAAITDSLQENAFNRLGNKFYYISNYTNDQVGPYTLEVADVMRENLNIPDASFGDIGIACLKRSFELNKYQPMNSSNMGFVHMERQEYAKAVPYYEYHFRLYNPFPENYLKATQCYAQLGNVTRVVELMQQALEMKNKYFVYKQLKTDPLLKPVIKDKKVKKLVKKFK